MNTDPGFPSSILLGAQRVEVLCNEKFDDADGESTHGETRHHPTGGPSIHLAAGPEDLTPATVSTFFHEVLHLIDEAYGLELDERGVRTLESALMAFFAQNPSVLPTLQEGLLGARQGQRLTAAVESFVVTTTAEQRELIAERLITAPSQILQQFDPDTVPNLTARTLNPDPLPSGAFVDTQPCPSRSSS